MRELEAGTDSTISPESNFAADKTIQPAPAYVPCYARQYECKPGVQYKVFTTLWIAFLFLYVFIIQVALAAMATSLRQSSVLTQPCALCLNLHVGSGASSVVGSVTAAGLQTYTGACAGLHQSDQATAATHALQRLPQCAPHGAQTGRQHHPPARPLAVSACLGLVCLPTTYRPSSPSLQTAEAGGAMQRAQMYYVTVLGVSMVPILWYTR